MSMLSSLSVWSAVKFPFLKFSRESKKATCSVESCDDLKKRNYERSEDETATELVNLTVPWNDNVDKENSEPNLYCECTRERKKTKKKKFVNSVKVPEIPLNDNQTESVENLPTFQIANFEPSESEQMPDDLEFKPEEVDDKDQGTNSIPTVKPWTAEELVEIKKEIQKGKKKMKIKKNKSIETMLKIHVRDLETSKKLVLPESKFVNVSTNCDFDCFNQFDDCEKFCSKLGLNPGFTKKTPQDSIDKKHKCLIPKPRSVGKTVIPNYINKCCKRL